MPVSAKGIVPPKPDHSNFVVNEASVNQVARALGFISGQTLRLNEIAHQHPHLARAAEERRVAFDGAYGFPELRAKWFLDHAIGEEKADSATENIRRQLRDSAQDRQKADALEFLEEVDARLGGRVDEPVLKAILWLRYGAQPSIEMRDWWQQFSSVGHPKAAGMDIRMRTPFSWRHDEGDRPHIVSKWTSQNGTGDMVITLLVRDLPGRLTYEDVRVVEQLADWDWLVADGFEFLAGSAIELDRQPGLQVDSMGERRILDASLTQRTRVYTLFPPNRIVQLGCTLGSESGADEAIYGRRFEAMKELCRQVALTVVFPDTYR
jgi:hypothetical protein